jgi:RNA polymerase sigma-54 factor
MSGMRLDLSQRQKQTQSLRMSPQMIQTISILSMQTAELSETIYKEAEKNPALEIVHDEMQEPVVVPEYKSPAVRVSSAQSGDSAESDAFQAFIESRPTRTETLQNHLLEQLALTGLDGDERALAEKIIGNLDRHGFFIEPPETLLNADNPDETPELLHKALAAVRRLDPAGIACADVYESLFLQAEASPSAPPLALFLLDGRLEILRNAKPQAVLKKIVAELQSASLPNCPPAEKISVQDVENALDFIRGLDPFPARSFDAEPTVYISPDVYVTRVVPDDDDAPKEAQFRITFAKSKLPRLSLSPLFREMASKKNRRGETKFAKMYIQEAKIFLDSIDLREQTIVKAAEAIVKAQVPFFEKGPRYLMPLRMKDIAGAIGVHETTVSRIANGKYLQCEWGLFEIRYFFTNQVSNESALLMSKEGVKQEILRLLKEHDARREKNPASKKLTDGDIVGRLKERGITIARRTVAKYRAELNINSSFDR